MLSARIQVRSWDVVASAILIKDAKQRGTEKIYLESSKNAKKLYREIGFTDIEDYMKLPRRETGHG